MRRNVIWAVAVVALVAIPAVIGLVALRGDDSSSSARRAGALVPAGGATAYQLQLIPGTAEGKDAIEVDSFSWSSTNATTIGSATGGAFAGKIKFNEFQITKKVDKASPLLFKQSASGAHYTRAILTLRKAEDKGPYMTYTMETVFVTDVKYSGGSPEVATEEVTFVFGKVTIQSVDKNPDGSPAAPVQAGWDQTTNKSWQG